MLHWRRSTRLGIRSTGSVVVGVLFAEVAKADLQLGAADDTGVHGALDVQRKRDPIPHFVIPHECNLLQENRWSLYELAGLADGHTGVGVNPEFAFKQAHGLLFGRDLQDLQGNSVTHDAAGIAEFVIGGGDGYSPIFASRTLGREI